MATVPTTVTAVTRVPSSWSPTFGSAILIALAPAGYRLTTVAVPPQFVPLKSSVLLAANG